MSGPPEALSIPRRPLSAASKAHLAAANWIQRAAASVVSIK